MYRELFTGEQDNYQWQRFGDLGREVQTPHFTPGSLVGFGQNRGESVANSPSLEGHPSYHHLYTVKL